LVVVFLGALLASCGADAPYGPVLAGMVREPAPDVSMISLPNASDGGSPLAMRARPDALLIMYFGYTSCPDVCPTTMADVSIALENLDADERRRVAVAMATIDPGRDTGELLTKYVRTFVPGANALRTDDPAALRAAADAFGADYRVTQTGAGEPPEVTHTGWLYVVDDRGRLRLQWAFGTKHQTITSDLRLLLAGGDGNEEAS
jgi:protein SCO1/2